MRVWVTRDEPPDGPLSQALVEHGLEPVHDPVLEKRPTLDPSQAIGLLSTDDWLVLTSPYAIQLVRDCEAARVPRVAVVGEPSARLAESAGLRVELISPDGHGPALFAELRNRATGGVICYPRSSLAQIPDTWASVELRAPILYETVAREFDRSTIERVDVVSVTSPSAVEAIGLVDLRYASIGRTTSAAVRKLGQEPWVEAAPPGIRELARAIVAQGEADRQPDGPT